MSLEGTERFSIGEVARMFRVSVSTLRHYEKIGLLAPEYVDPATGYRSYSTRQFECLNTSRYLRALEMPLEQIRDFLQDREVGKIQGMLLQQRQAVIQKRQALGIVQRKIENRLRQIQDALEGITHSLCSLEYENHRPLYDWVVEHCDVPSRPRQIEFARLGINYTVLSKRKLRALVENGQVAGWDDPRMPTLCGLRRRGYTPKSIRNFCERIGVSKVDSTVDWAFLESCLREDLNETAQRVMAVLRPVKLTITNYPEEQQETVTVENNPVDPAAGERQVPFSRHLYIEADDFLETPIPKYKRLTPGGQECRLKGAYLIRCTGCVKNEAGEVVEVLCEYDPESKGGNPADGRKVKGATIHWVDAATAADAEVRLYDYLFTDPAPDAADKNFLDYLNPDSLQILTGCKVEQGLAQAAMPEKGKTATAYQFMRQGYFCLDNQDAAPGHLVFNRSVSLKDSFKKK